MSGTHFYPYVAYMPLFRSPLSMISPLASNRFQELLCDALHVALIIAS